MNSAPSYPSIDDADARTPRRRSSSPLGGLSIASLTVSPAAPAPPTAAVAELDLWEGEYDADAMDRKIFECSTNVWSVPSLRPLQKQAARVLMDPNSPDQILIVLPVGGGKTHIIRTVGVIFR